MTKFIYMCLGIGALAWVMISYQECSRRKLPQDSADIAKLIPVDDHNTVSVNGDVLDNLIWRGILAGDLCMQAYKERRTPSRFAAYALRQCRALNVIDKDGKVTMPNPDIKDGEDYRTNKESRF